MVADTLAAGLVEPGSRQSLMDIFALAGGFRWPISGRQVVGLPCLSMDDRASSGLR